MCYKWTWVHIWGGLWRRILVGDAACGRPNWT